METTNATPDFGLVDFMPEADYQQFFDLVDVGNNAGSAVQFCPEIDSFEDIIAGSSFGGDGSGQLVFPGQEGLFDFDLADILDGPDCALQALPGDQEGNAGEGEESSDTPATPTPSQSKRSTAAKSDRSRIINSERRRRGTMKEKLYSLRALVPNITKMDRASIVGDAIRYVQDLQKKAETLKNEIIGLQQSSQIENRQPEKSAQNLNKENFADKNPIIKKIFQIDVAQIEETEFHVRLVCKTGIGVAASLCKVLESLSNFRVQSTNLASAAEDYVLTFTVKVKSQKVDIDLSSLKLLIATAFLNEGFDFEKSQSAVAEPCDGLNVSLATN